MRIDTAGLARGYAADAMFRALRDNGCPQARVDAGNVAVVGAPPPGRAGWTVAVYGIADSKGRPPSLTLSRTAVAYWPWPPAAAREAGVLPPVIDPVTGRPLPGRTPTAVMAPGGSIAEGAAAMASVLGPGGYRTLTAAEGGAKVQFGVDRGPVPQRPRR
jgi:thiamine biosynthesis lipoprotein